MKKILSTHQAPARHWVGDGFPVHGLFGYNEGADARTPFLMLDYAAPYNFEPTTKRRGVGSHPHRGFETVTIVYDGEVEHRDSTGNGGVIGKGDVQWMTAGDGIIHSEFHSPDYASKGGPFEMAQLWVNLPASAKKTAAHYQAITSNDIPSVAIENGTVRIIAGSFNDTRGPANTYTPMNVLDVRLQAGATATLPQPEGWTTIIVVLDGTVMVNGEAVLRATEYASLLREGSDVTIEANSDAKLLLLSGEPIDEPIVGYGPFVMNSQAEIIQSIHDFNAGKFGTLA